MKKIVFILLVAFAVVSNSYAEHEHHAPHHGTLIVLGEEFAHLELVLDGATGTLSAYSLDGEAENAIPLTQSEIIIKITPQNDEQFDLALKALENPLTGETAGNTSEFKGQSETLKGISKFAGIIRAVVTNGQKFNNVVFDFPEGNEHNEEEEK